MRKQNLQKEELDRIGRRLLETARISNEEIEQIAAAPQLFGAVKTRIKTEQRERKLRSYSGSSWNSIFWNWQRISVVSAVLALFVFGAVSFVLINQSLQVDEQAAVVPAIQTQSEAIETPEIPEDFPEIEELKNPEIKPRLIAKKETVKKEILRKPNVARKTPSVKRPSQTQVEMLSDFYALNYAGNPNDTDEDFRIVRTELSPSALFALGMNVPIENGKGKIKTDLLVGTDGVARAIRFVE
ncbi:MAG TPA: hypothetical protein VK892_03385 [Pyrinomonadaceae bacterium]|nr:hypothetical protein [Pyrinomonadaceae bacterium]